MVSFHRPHCSFFIAAAWPMFVLALFVSQQILPEIFYQKAVYPVWTILVVGLGNLLALIIWYHILGRDGMEYSRFILGAIITSILGIYFFGHLHQYKNPSTYYKYVATMFVTYQVIFPLIYFSEKWFCQKAKTHKIII